MGGAFVLDYRESQKGGENPRGRSGRLFVVGGQLAAGGVDVGAEVLPHRVVDFILSKDGLEFLDRGISWLLERG